jgi:hypothetical protein
MIPITSSPKPSGLKGLFHGYEQRKAEKHEQKKMEKMMKNVNRKYEIFYEKQALRLNREGYSREDAENIIRKAISKQKIVEVVA